MRESEWNTVDVAALIASRREHDVVRGAHGIPMVEATDPTVTFEVPLPVTDFAARELQKAQDAYAKNYPDSKSDRSLIWRVRRTE